MGRNLRKWFVILMPWYTISQPIGNIKEICSRSFHFFFDYLSFEGFCSAVGHLDTPTQNRAKKTNDIHCPSSVCLKRRSSFGHCLGFLVIMTVHNRCISIIYIYPHLPYFEPKNKQMK